MHNTLETPKDNANADATLSPIFDNICFNYSIMHRQAKYYSQEANVENVTFAKAPGQKPFWNASLNPLLRKRFRVVVISANQFEAHAALFLQICKNHPKRAEK